MQGINEMLNDETSEVNTLVRKLNQILDPNKSMDEILDQLVQDVYELGHCDHVFLSRYDIAAKKFIALAWRSSINPSIVTPEKKFMSESYIESRMVVIKDLSKYNYRLQTGAARLGLLSMVGIPLVTKQGVIGVLEMFSHKQDNFPEETIELLNLFAKQAAIIIDKDYHEKECKSWAIENEFLHETPKLEQASAGMFLYRLGETLTSLLNAHSIVVFGIDMQTEYDVLQEVMAKGFSMQDISRFKKAFTKDFLEKLTNMSNDASEHLIIKHHIKGLSIAEEKMMYIVPVVRRQMLHGIIVFYSQQSNTEADMERLERFVKRITGYVAKILDRKHLYSNIQRISFTDQLTDLANRRLFDYVLNREFDKVKRTSRPLSLLMIDIDYFKQVNDLYGHLAGDAILEQLGSLMKKYFRSIDMSARYGGEEFVVILPDTDQENAMLVAERFRTLVADHTFVIDSKNLHLSVSIGVATHNIKSGGGFAHVEAFIHATDQALYQAKQQGRNRIVLAGTYID